MNSRQNDDLSHIPTMKPARDEVVERKQAGSRSGPKPAASSGSSGLTVFALIVALLASAAALYLWDQLRQLGEQFEQSSERIVALEGQLANTGDEISQSDAAVRVQLKTLDTEVRKLWDNVWKKSKAQLEEHDKSIRNLTSRSGKDQKSIKSNAGEITSISAELYEISETVDELEKSFGSRSEQAAQLRDVSDKLNQVTVRLESMDKRLRENEDWVDSFNAFRRQVNQKLQPSNSGQDAPVLQ